MNLSALRPVGVKSTVFVSSQDSQNTSELQRHRKMMSEAAVLSYLALERALTLNQWSVGDESYAYYLGVGASGSTKQELNRILSASASDHEFSMSLFGEAGLAACNPLFAFQLMNNFTLCHAAILKKIRGPNSAFYSRGTGTVAALQEAVFSIAESEVNRGFAGAADTALHPVTLGELRREGQLQSTPREGAGLLSLSADLTECQAVIRQVSFGQGVWKKTEDLNAHSVLMSPTRKEKNEEFLAVQPVCDWIYALEKLKNDNLSSVAVISETLDLGWGLVIFDKCLQ